MEYETIALVVVLVGIFSTHQQLAIRQGNKEHARLDTKINKLAKHLGLKSWESDK